MLNEFSITGSQDSVTFLFNFIGLPTGAQITAIMSHLIFMENLPSALQVIVSLNPYNSTMR